uniref:Uncharacterized protein n=1 Tax=Cacopsylla melanoneura TaxID=428564 RepID=A0A8D8LJY1_9HEMI
MYGEEFRGRSPLKLSLRSNLATAMPWGKQVWVLWRTSRLRLFIYMIRIQFSNTQRQSFYFPDKKNHFLSEKSSLTFVNRNFLLLLPIIRIAYMFCLNPSLL